MQHDSIIAIQAQENASYTESLRDRVMIFSSLSVALSVVGQEVIKPSAY